MMSFLPLLCVGGALALCLGPVLLLRAPGRRRGPEGASGGPAPAAIVRNAWIAYGLRVSVVVPLFAFGAAGDLWPAVVGCAGYATGILLLAALRPLLDPDRPDGGAATLHAALASASGDAAGVRLATALATTVALVGLAGAEAAALSGVVTPLLGGRGGIACFVVLLGGAVLYASGAGPIAVRYGSQALLGAIFVGLFGSTAFLLYLNASDLHPMPPHGSFALLALSAGSVALLTYRQTKYTETPHLAPPEATTGWRRTLGRQVRLAQRLANLSVSVFAVLVVVICGMEFYFLGFSGTVRDGLAAFATPRIPFVGLAAIAMLAVAYPLVDAVAWQSARALADAARASGPGGGAAAVRRPIRMVGGETAMLGVVVAAFGALAALSTDLPADALGLQDLVGQLILFDHGITDAALSLLLVCLFAMASATMGMAVSAAMATIRLDVVPIIRPDVAPTPPTGPGDRTGMAMLGALTIVVAAIWIASGVPAAGFADAGAFAVAVAFACLQVSLLPLLLARLRGMTVSTGAALAVPVAGVAAGLATVAAYGLTGDRLWLWAAVPACLVAGLLIAAATARRGAVAVDE